MQLIFVRTFRSMRPGRSLQQKWLAHIRFELCADITPSLSHIRFVSEGLFTLERSGRSFSILIAVFSGMPIC
jgi:hypothetical protein